MMVAHQANDYGTPWVMGCGRMYLCDHVKNIWENQVWSGQTPPAQELPQPGRWLGVANDIGTGTLSYCVIDEKGHVYARISNASWMTSSRSISQRN
jgi:hypothetical protein